MKSLALVVPRSEGERVRRVLSDLRCLRADLRIRADAESVSFPLASRPDVDLPGGQFLEREFDPVDPERPRSYRDLLDLPAAEESLLPRAFDVVGDIVLIRLPPELEARKREVGAALLAFVPGARVVALDRGVKGPERRRELERIAGAGPWTTRHAENGLTIDVDLARAYFSPRLAREHALVASAVRPGETVYDLCCGVGPFTLTIARDARATEVVAVDFNPDAVRLLRTNLERLGFEGKVRAVDASLEEFLPSAGLADRVVLNLPHEGIKYVPSVGMIVRPSGTLHYYEVTEKTMTEGRGSALVRILGREPTRWQEIEHHVVHPYAPDADLVAYSLRRAEA